MVFSQECYCANPVVYHSGSGLRLKNVTLPKIQNFGGCLFVEKIVNRLGRNFRVSSYLAYLEMIKLQDPNSLQKGSLKRTYF